MRRILISLTVIVLLFIPQFASADDLADLKAAQEKVIQAWNKLDALTLISAVYPAGAIVFDYDAAFPSISSTAGMTQEQLEAVTKNAFNDLEYVSLTPYNLQYKVVGTTGIVWGYSSMSTKPKGEPVRTQNSRYTSTWVKSDGKWYVICTHISAIPTGD